MVRSSSLGMITHGQQQTKCTITVPSAAVGGGASRAPQVTKPVKVPVPRIRLILLNMVMSLFHSALAFVTLYFGKIDLNAPLYRSSMNFTWNVNTTPPWDLVPVYSTHTWIFISPSSLQPFSSFRRFFTLATPSYGRKFYLSELNNVVHPRDGSSNFSARPS